MFDLVPKQRRRRLRSHQVGCVLRFARPRMVGPYIFFNHMSALLPPGVPPTKDVRTASAYRLVDLLSGESLPRDSVRSELLITCNGIDNVVDRIAILDEDRTSAQESRLGEVAESVPVTLTPKSGVETRTDLRSPPSRPS